MIDKFSHGFINSVYHFNDYTLNELICKLAQKMDEVITQSNESFNYLEWLKGQGLSDEVIKIMLEWKENGTLENLINEILFNKLNTKIDENKAELDESINVINSQLDTIESLNIKLIDYKHLVVGDDWTNALQTALNDAYNQKRNIVAHYGNFKLTSTIYIPPLITFSGVGMDLTNFIIEHDGVAFKYIGKNDTSNPTQSGGGKASDFTIKRNQPSTKIEGNHGIHLIGTFSQTSFERIKILDMGEHGFYLYDETKNKGTGNITFKDCYFGGCIYGYGFCAEGIFSDLLLQGVNSWGNAGAFCFDGSKNNSIGFRGQNVTLQGCNNEYNGGWNMASASFTKYASILIKNLNNVRLESMVLQSSPKRNDGVSYVNLLVVDGCSHLSLNNLNLQNKIGDHNNGITLTNVFDGEINDTTVFSSQSGGYGLTINPNCSGITINNINVNGWGTNCKLDATTNAILVKNKGRFITIKGQLYQGDFDGITTKTIDDFTPSYNKVNADRTKYCRIANIKITAQNGTVNANLFVNTTAGNGGQYGNMLAQGILNIRVGQTSVLGNNPWVGLVYTPCYSSNPTNDTGKITLSSKNFYYKITNISTSESVVEIYYRPSQAWLPLSYYPLTIYEENGIILLLKDNNIDVTGATQGETQNRMILQDGTGTIWQITINENGELQTSKPSVD